MEEALKVTIIALKNFCTEAMAWFDKVFPPETRADMIHHWIHVALSYLMAALLLVIQKLKEAPLALKHSAEEAWAWFDEAYPPEARAEKINQWKHITQSYIIAAVGFLSEAIQFTPQKLKEAPLALKNSCEEAWTWFNKAYSPEKRAEKFKQWQQTLTDSGLQAWAWFYEAYRPPETRAEQINRWLLINRPYLVAAVVVVVSVLICRCCFGGRRGGAVKMMKAPGRNFRMPRANFQENPRGYFRDLRTCK